MGGAFAFGVLGCGGAQGYDPPAPDAQKPTSMEAASTASLAGSGPLTPSPAEQGPFAASALTPLAEQLAALARAALDGGPLPSELPLEQPVRADALVESEEALPAAADLDFFLLALEICLDFDSETPDGAGVKAGLVLTRTGVRVASLGGCSGRGDAPLPEWLRGVEQASRDLARALDDGSIRELIIGESDRPAFGNDAVFDALAERRPTLAQIDRARRKSEAKYRGASLSELGVIARVRAGEIWGFLFEVGERRGQIVLCSSPLLDVRRFRPPPPRTHERS